MTAHEKFTSCSSQELLGLAAILCTKYKISDREHLLEALGALKIFRNLHSNVSPVVEPTRKGLAVLRREYENLTTAARNIQEMKLDCGAGVALLAISRLPDVTVALHVMRATSALSDHRVQFQEKGGQSTLTALMVTLGLVWLEAGYQYGAVDFIPAASGLRPLPGTCSAFMVECLRATGWSWSNEQIAANCQHAAHAAVELLQFHGMGRCLSLNFGGSKAPKRYSQY